MNERLSRLGELRLVPTASAGVKGARVASGEADLYAHPTQSAINLWDACAPDAIVASAGGVFSDATGVRFDYRGPVSQRLGVLAGNPALHASALARLVETQRGGEP